MNAHRYLTPYSLGLHRAKCYGWSARPLLSGRPALNSVALPLVAACVCGHSAWRRVTTTVSDDYTVPPQPIGLLGTGMLGDDPLVLGRALANR